VEKPLSQTIDSKRYQLADPTIFKKLHNVEFQDLKESGSCTIVADVIEHYCQDKHYVTAHGHQLKYTLEEFMATPFADTAVYYREARMVARSLECSRDRTEELEKLGKSLILRFTLGLLRRLCLQYLFLSVLVVHPEAKSPVSQRYTF
jgi:hypothetical protein